MSSEIENRVQEQGITIDGVIAAMQQFSVETPTWGYGDSGTRFKVFHWLGAARNLREKLADAAQVQRVTGICPGVAIHIPWDREDDWYAVKEYAGQLGLRIGAVNPNLFQDDTYRFGSLCHFDKAVRQRAIAHVVECIHIAQSVDSNVISLWLADGTNYPGQDDLLGQLDILAAMLPPVVEAGTALGEVLPEWRGDLGAAKVVAPATHDPGSAIVAIPAQYADGWGYISSGPWSLVGVELPRPVMTQESLAANFTNEGGVFGTTRYLKNVMGLWLLQECQRRWNRDGHAIDYDTLLADVDAVPAFAALIDPDDPRFLAPQNMPDAIDAYLLEYGQAPLAAPAGFARCIMESLVLRYRKVFQQISHLTGAIINQVHVGGGGAQRAAQPVAG